MTGMDEREQAFENLFVHNNDLRFKAKARRNKKLGEWAAEQIGLPPLLADEYWKEVVRTDLLGVGDEHVYQKIKADFDKVNVEVSEHQIRRTMTELMDAALKEVREEE